MKRSHLNQRSLKSMALDERREACRDEVMIRARGMCEGRLSDCELVASDVHEIKTRARGGDITDPDNCLALCRSCHRYITDHPAWALERGFVVHSWATSEDMERATEIRRENFF